MSCFTCILLTLIVTLAVFIIFKRLKKCKCATLPQFENTWWGKEEKTSEIDESVQPFTINIDEKIISDLRNRLKNAKTLIKPLEGVQHQYGINTNLLEKIIDFWINKYDWREREKFLNKFAQFTIKIQGLRIHYLHVKPEAKEGVKVLPLLLLHGWPGSVREFYEIIPLLTTLRENKNYVFEVIAPSLPGYGFSEAAARPGLGAAQMAVVFRNFMNRLGFKKYYIQGGDWGAIITRSMATFYPEEILGLHSNMCGVNTPISMVKTVLGSFWPSWIVSKEHESKMYPLTKQWAKLLQETGYMHLQATKPDTIGVALNDSPIGLAAYILEKFITWTNFSWIERKDGGLSEKYSYTALLDNIMIYWVTSSITTSMRLYSETMNKAQFKLKIEKFPVTVPTACVKFSNELIYQPKTILKEKFTNIVHDADYDGGHFAAFELPELMANDIFEAIGKMELLRAKGV